MKPQLIPDTSALKAMQRRRLLHPFACAFVAGVLLVGLLSLAVHPASAGTSAGQRGVEHTMLGVQQLADLPGYSFTALIVEISPNGMSPSHRHPGEVYGVTNAQFTGAYAEYALATATMIAPKPKTLTHIQAASVPVVAITAWQMLFDYA